MTVDCRKSSWNDIENDEWADQHEQYRGPTPETINMDVRLDHSQRLLQREEEERKLQEERWWLQEAQRQLTEEKEKLARERKQLEVLLHTELVYTLSFS